jgi:phage shock protein C
MTRRLVKSKDKKVFGVCGGLGDYLEVDPTIIRIAFVLAFFGFGTGVLAYIILAIVMPSE